MNKSYLSKVLNVMAGIAVTIGLFVPSNSFGQTMVTAVTTDSICLGDTVKLAASFAGSTMATFAWEDTSGAMSISAPTGDTVSVYPLTTTSYRIIGDTSGVKDTSYFTVTVKASPVINTGALKSTICAGDTATLWASGGTGNYNWGTLTGTILPFTSDTINVVPSNNTTYVALGYGVNGCRDTSWVAVNVNTTGPNVKIIGDSMGCQGKTQVMVGTGASTYEWYSSANPSTPFASSDTAADASITNKKYWVFGTDSTGCIGSDTLDYVAGKNPRESMEGFIGGIKMNLGGIPSVCFDEEVTLQAALGTNTYKWSSTGTISDTTGSSTKFTLASGSQSVTFTVDSSNGCSTTISKSFVSTVQKPALIVDWVGDSVICIGDSTQARANSASGGGNAIYNWTPSASVVDPSAETATLFPTITTKYTVGILSNGCTATADITVEVKPVPDISLSQSSGGTPICKDESDTITITSNAGVLFDWGYGITSKSKVKAIAPRVTETITITAYSAEGCVNSASITINVDTSCGINLNVVDFNAQQEIKTFVYSSNLNLNFREVPTEKVTVDVLNLTGAVVLSRDLGVIENNENHQIILEGLTTGMYILRVKGESYELINKIYK